MGDYESVVEYKLKEGVFVIKCRGIVPTSLVNVTIARNGKSLETIFDIPFVYNGGYYSEALVKIPLGLVNLGRDESFDIEVWFNNHEGEKRVLMRFNSIQQT